MPAFIADPVVVDELDALARYSGLPDLPRRSIFHALNQKACARRAARELGKPYEECALIVAHLGGGVSVGVHLGGRVRDVNNALDGDGPFAVERAGGLPSGDWLRYVLAHREEPEALQRRLTGRGGVVAYLGTNDARRIEEAIAAHERGERRFRGAGRQALPGGAAGHVLPDRQGDLLPGGRGFRQAGRGGSHRRPGPQRAHRGGDRRAGRASSPRCSSIPGRTRWRRWPPPPTTLWKAASPSRSTASRARSMFSARPVDHEGYEADAAYGRPVLLAVLHPVVLLSRGSRLDRNGDGRPDQWYEVADGRVTGLSLDRNFDEQVDYTVEYDARATVKPARRWTSISTGAWTISTFSRKGSWCAQEVDSNFDGRIDLWVSLEGQYIRGYEMDRDFDGVAEVRKAFGP